MAFVLSSLMKITMFFLSNLHSNIVFDPLFLYFFCNIISNSLRTRCSISLNDNNLQLCNIKLPSNEFVLYMKCDLNFRFERVTNLVLLTFELDTKSSVISQCSIKQYQSKCFNLNCAVFKSLFFPILLIIVSFIL